VIDPVDDARATLLRALDELGKATDELDGPAERADVVVIYSVGRSAPDDGRAWHEVGGWACPSGPKWVHAALLRRAADAQDDAARAVDDEGEDE
jgi:hypothetical protein